MGVYHIVEKAYPAVAVRTVRNRRSAEFLLLHLGDSYEIVEDLCSDIRKKSVDVLADHAYNMRKAMEGSML